MSVLVLFMAMLYPKYGIYTYWYGMSQYLYLMAASNILNEYYFLAFAHIILGLYTFVFDWAGFFNWYISTVLYLFFNQSQTVKKLLLVLLVLLQAIFLTILYYRKIIQYAQYVIFEELVISDKYEVVILAYFFYIVTCIPSMGIVWVISVIIKIVVPKDLDSK